MTLLATDRHRQFRSRRTAYRRRPRSAGRWLILGSPRFASSPSRSSRRSTLPASTPPGFANWRPILYAYVLWSIALGVGLVLSRGEAGHRALFVLPAVLFILAMAVFPTLFGFYIAFTDWNLSSLTGRKFNGLDNFIQLVHDPFYWNALRQHGLLRAGDRRRICDRLRAGAAAQPGNPGAKVFPRRVPAPVHAEPGRGQLDDRQVDARIPLRPGRATSRACSAGTIPPSSPRPGSRAVYDRGAGRLGLRSRSS